MNGWNGLVDATTLMGQSGEGHHDKKIIT